MFKYYLNILNILIILQVTEIYNTFYAPKEVAINNIEHNSDDEDLISHISKRQRIKKISELDKFLKTDRASALCNSLSWWKVSLLKKYFFNHLKY